MEEARYKINIAVLYCIDERAIQRKKRTKQLPQCDESNPGFSLCHIFAVVPRGKNRNMVRIQSA